MKQKKKKHGMELTLMKYWADLHPPFSVFAGDQSRYHPGNWSFGPERKGLALIGTGDLTHPAWRGRNSAQSWKQRKTGSGG